ncbi:MAG: hypothetical protein JSV88_02090 [Candidatus Aminicenantes bacterium]|nr:MAG: hypothetical protein JSV88_02090 [Candidatus Aminicenantes bacterium]
MNILTVGLLKDKQPAGIPKSIYMRDVKSPFSGKIEKWIILWIYRIFQSCYLIYLPLWHFERLTSIVLIFWRQQEKVLSSFAGQEESDG